MDHHCRYQLRPTNQEFPVQLGTILVHPASLQLLIHALLETFPARLHTFTMHKHAIYEGLLLLMTELPGGPSPLHPYPVHTPYREYPNLGLFDHIWAIVGGNTT